MSMTVAMYLLAALGHTISYTRRFLEPEGEGEGRRVAGEQGEGLLHPPELVGHPGPQEGQVVVE